MKARWHRFLVAPLARFALICIPRGISFPDRSYGTRALALASVSMLFLSAAGSVAHAEIHAMGHRPPTPAEQAYVERTYTRVLEVAPNALALQRAQAEAEAARSRGENVSAAPSRPAAADNSTRPTFPPIGDQGHQGSCTAWAAAYYYNTYAQAADEGYVVSGGDHSHICSPAFTYNLVNGGEDIGSYTQYVVGRLNDVGCSSWNLMPYSDSDYTTWPSQAAWVDAIRNRTRSAQFINGSSASGLEAIKQHLANGDIAVTDFRVYDNFGYYPSSATGISNSVYYAPAGSLRGGHAVTIVGYDDTRSYVDSRDGSTHYGAFLLANSWGTGWGVRNSTGSGSEGFFWVAYSMFLEQTFGPSFYYNTDRERYRPTLYAVTGINHADRYQLTLDGGVGSPLTWTSYRAISDDGEWHPTYSISSSLPIAIDLSDSPSTPPLTASVWLAVTAGAGSAGSIASAEFYDDFDGDGAYRRTASSDPVVSVTPGASGYADATIAPTTHTVSAGASVSPSVIQSGSSTSLSANASCNQGHAITAWTWTDSGAGGVFTPSRNVQNPTYTGPGNTGGAPVQRTLTLTATCSGGVSGSTSTVVTENNLVHSVSVTASATPSTVSSGGTTQLAATAVDSLGHSVSSWTWTDNGAGGTFSPSRFVQNPSYTAPGNGGTSQIERLLSVVAGCNGPTTAAGNANLIVTENFLTHVVSVTASSDVSTIRPGGTARLSAAASDTLGHGIASWSWTDNGAGGVFAPSALVQNPTWIGPGNDSSTTVQRRLTVTAWCGGSPATLGTADVYVAEEAHRLTVSLSAANTTVTSGDSTQLSAIASDNAGHGGVSWAWSDSGAGGTFSPSPFVANPMWTAPGNTTGAPVYRQISVTGTCGGLSPKSASASIVISENTKYQFIPICTEASYQGYVTLSEDIAVWWDFRGHGWDNGDIYGRDLQTGQEFLVCSAPGMQMFPSISGRTVVWKDCRDTGGDEYIGDVYGYDLDTQAMFQVTSHGLVGRCTPGIDGNIVVWADRRNEALTGMDIYGYDIGTQQEFPICTAPGDQSMPAISGDIVVWVDARNAATTGLDIYGYDLSTDQEFAVSTAAGDQGHLGHLGNIAIDGNVVVWQDARSFSTSGWDIYSGDISSGIETPVCTHWGDQWAPAVSGDTIVWEDYRNDPNGYWGGEQEGEENPDIYGYNILEAREFGICTAPGLQWQPAISGQLVAWQSFRGSLILNDVYGCRLDDTVSVMATAAPATIASGGTTQLNGTVVEDQGRSITSWAWSDNGAGGTFSPSASVQNPTWSGPGNSTDSPVFRRLTVTAFFDGQPPMTATSGVVVVEDTNQHAVAVTAYASPATLHSGASTQLAAEADDALGHVIANWSWRDNGAGGTFSPSATVQGPVYVAPENVTTSDVIVTLTVTAACGSAPTASGTGQVTVTVHPHEDFTDVPYDHWAFGEIEACYHAGIAMGYATGAYMPEGQVTRDQMAVYVSRAVAGGDAYVPTGPAVASFPDVPADHWAFKYIEYAKAQGIVQGYEDGYHPELPVDRAQMAAYVSRAVAEGDANVPPGPPDPSFPDVPIDSWAYKYVEYCRNHGIVQGYSDGYHPEIIVTRDQMAVYIARAFELLD